MAIMRPGFQISRLKEPDELIEKLKEQGLEAPVSSDLDGLRRPVEIYGKTLPNSTLIQPMEGADSDTDGSPTKITERRYGKFARQGAAVIWFEATAVTEDGRDCANQLWIRPENVDKFKALVDEVDRISLEANGFKPYKILQLTHSGRCAETSDGKPHPKTAFANPYLDTTMGKAEVVSDEFYENLKKAIAEGARLAKEAGFDAVDLKLCHQYIMKEMLCAYTRPGRYGGSIENRFRFAFETIDAIKEAVGDAVDIVVRLSAYDSVPYPYGWGMKQTPGVMEDDQAEVDILLDELSKRGVELVNITTNEPRFAPEDLGYLSNFLDNEYIDQFRGVSHLLKVTRELKKKHSELKLVATGLAYFAQFAPYVGSGGIEQGWFDLAGFGRNIMADDSFLPNAIKNDFVDQRSLCMRCDSCYRMFDRKIPTGCMVRDPFYQMVDTMDKKERTDDKGKNSPIM